MKIRPVGAQAVPCGWADTRTDKYEESNSRFSQFCERASKALVTLLVVCSCYLFDTFTAAFYIPRPTPSIAKLTTRHAMSEVDNFGFTGNLHVMPQGHAKVVLRIIRLQDKENTRQFYAVCLTLSVEKQSTLSCWKWRLKAHAPPNIYN